MKQKKRVNIYIIVTIALIFQTAISLYFSISEIRELKKERAQINVYIEEEKEKQITIQGQKHYYESDSYIEKTAREKLGLVKSNDIVFIDRNNN